MKVMNEMSKLCGVIVDVSKLLNEPGFYEVGCLVVWNTLLNACVDRLE